MLLDRSQSQYTVLALSSQTVGPFPRGYPALHRRVFGIIRSIGHDDGRSEAVSPARTYYQRCHQVKASDTTTVHIDGFLVGTMPRAAMKLGDTARGRLQQTVAGDGLSNTSMTPQRSGLRRHIKETEKGFPEKIAQDYLKSNRIAGFLDQATNRQIGR